MSTERESAEKNEQGCGPDSCARLKPSVEDVARLIEPDAWDESISDLKWHDDYGRTTSPGRSREERRGLRDGSVSRAKRILALFPGRTEAEVWDEAWQAGAHAGLDTGLQIAENVHANGGVLDLTALPPSPYRA